MKEKTAGKKLSITMEKINDPLYLGKSNVITESVLLPQFTGGKGILDDLERLTRSENHITEVIYGPKDVQELFDTLFPELVESNQIGKLDAQSFEIWERPNNEVTIELDPKPELQTGKKFDVYVGGPSALCAAAIQAKSSASEDVIYIHDGNRGASNWKGSASQIHNRDAVPTYYWGSNTGLSAIWKSFRNFVHRKWNTDSYLENIKNKPVGFAYFLHLPNALRDPLIIKLFVMNLYYSFRDIGGVLGIDSKFRLPNAPFNVARTLSKHCFAQFEILRNLKLDEAIVKSSEHAKSLFLHEGKSDGPIIGYNLLRSRVGNDVGYEFNILSRAEKEKRGFDPDLLDLILEFPNDGYVPPYTDGLFEKTVTENRGIVQTDKRLKTILVTPTNDLKDATVTRAIFEDRLTKERSSINVKTLCMSLGPSMDRLKVVVPRELASWRNLFQRENILEKMIPGSGVTVNFLVKIDLTRVPAEAVTKFRDICSSEFKHYIRLGEKDAEIDGKPFKFFAMQASGGGCFPSRHAYSEAGLSIMHTYAMKVLNLCQDGIEFDILTIRSCTRGVTGSNSIKFAAPASNMAMTYGLGGIGMTSMVSNALMMKAIIGLRQELGNSEISEADFFNRLRSSNFKSIPHYDYPNPFMRNYAPFVDKQVRGVAKRLGFEKAAQKNMEHLKTSRHLLQLVKRVAK